MYAKTESDLDLTAAALAGTVQSHGVQGLAIEKIDGDFPLGTPFGTALERAGFTPFPRGIRLRG